MEDYRDLHGKFWQKQTLGDKCKHNKKELSHKVGMRPTAFELCHYLSRSFSKHRHSPIFGHTPSDCLVLGKASSWSFLNCAIFLIQGLERKEPGQFQKFNDLQL